ncbi:MAG: sensor histidine kinase [Maledivibacter sp.]|jgi:signal transduction histidine kinase|nr:sensor histidine kinase [Maledivibacter sp.]
MKLKEYLSDRRYLFLFYATLMFFISLVVYLDPSVKVGLDNIIYINIVAFVFFIIYFMGSYLYNKRYYSTINYIIENFEGDIINSLPEPKTHKQYLYNQLFKRIYQQQNDKIEGLYENKKENFEYITSWVHEVKTPIAASRLIIENSMGKSHENILNSIEEELDKIETKVEQVLYYSRIDAFSKDYLIGEINLEKALKEIIKKHAKVFINKRIKVEMENVNMDVSTDKKWLLFIMDQILTNSLKYTDSGGKIRVSTEKDNKEKRLIIEDSGIGIKPEDIGRIFEKGFTGYTGRQNYRSTGMGLYLAKRLARKLGHDISVESVYGEYTRLTIHFPKLINYYNLH